MTTSPAARRPGEIEPEAVDVLAATFEAVLDAPRDAVARVRHAEALVAIGSFGEAIEVCDRVLGKAPGEAGTPAVWAHAAEVRAAAVAAAAAAAATAAPGATVASRTPPGEYGERCRQEADNGQPPLRWPARTQGSALRIAIFAAAGDAGVGAALPRLPVQTLDGVEVWRVLLTAGPDAGGGAGESLLPAADWPAEAIARVLAELDVDVLIDRVGLDDPRVGAVLARRPARVQLLDAARVPGEALEAGLHDDELSPQTLGGAAHAAAAAQASPATARELAALWREAIAAHQSGRRDAAEATYRRVLELQPRHAPTHFMLGMLARRSGRPGDAAVELERALEAAPRFLDARLQLASLLVERGNAQAADRTLSEAPNIGRAARSRLLLARSAALRACGDAPAAERLANAAVLADPRASAAWLALGSLAAQQGKLPESRRALLNASALAPGDAIAAFNLASLLQRLGELPGARRHYERAVTLRLGFTAALKQLGDTLFALRDIDAWIANFRRLERECPPSLPLACYALHALPYAGDLDGVERVLRLLVDDRLDADDDRERADALEELLYLLLFFDIPPQLLHRYYLRYDQLMTRLAGTGRAAAHRSADGAAALVTGAAALVTGSAASVTGGSSAPATRRARPRIRIGYLSADFRDHVMGRMCLDAIARHDRGRFEIIGYRMNRHTDAWTDRFSQAMDRMVDISALDADDDAAARIAADRVDLLVDLSTHTLGARPGILARKPAPVQVGFVASAGALGLRAIDWKLTDAWCDPPENQQWLIEKLLYVDGGVYPLRFPARDATARVVRNAFGIPGDACVLGAFVTPLKLSRRCLRLWAQVMQQTPHALLLFSPNSEAEHASYVRLAAAGGIDAARVRFAPQRGGEATNLARYDVVDLVLDPMPFGGVNGTMEALAAGVPVVSLRGARHGERTTASILERLRLQATVVDDETAYVELACRLLADPAERAIASSAVRAAVAGWDEDAMRRYTRELESAYLRALQTPAGRRPEPAA